MKPNDPPTKLRCAAAVQKIAEGRHWSKTLGQREVEQDKGIINKSSVWTGPQKGKPADTDRTEQIPGTQARTREAVRSAGKPLPDSPFQSSDSGTSLSCGGSNADGAQTLTVLTRRQRDPPPPPPPEPSPPPPPSPPLPPPPSSLPLWRLVR